MEHSSKDDDDSPGDEECVLPTSPAEPEKYKSPKRLMRTCLASLDDSTTFGKMVAAEAHRKGFFKAKRQAFVADGMKCNWTMWKTHFPNFVPIADFIHVTVQGGGCAIGQFGGFRLGVVRRMDSCVLAGASG
ncbi:MAG: hypothetical protein R3C59_22050 [Planctomycetaceae bacterium]